MKIISPIILLILLSIPSWAQYKTGYGDLMDSETVGLFKKHVSYLASPAREGRAPGSVGEREAAAYVSKALEEYGLAVISGQEGDDFGIKLENGDTLTSCNVVAYIPGYDKELKSSYILIGARLDNLGSSVMMVDGEPSPVVYHGANGDASGLAMLIELGKRLQTNSMLLRRSVLLVAFGASTNTFAGSWYFLNRAFKDAGKIDAMVDLDIVGGSGPDFYAYTCSNADMNQIAKAMESTLQPIRPKVVAAEPFQSDNMAFYDKSIPSILFTTGRYPEYQTPKDKPDILDYEKMEDEMEYIYNYAVSVANGPKPIFSPEQEVRKRIFEGDGVIPYYDCERRPAFLGNSDPGFFLQKWVYQYIRYPEAAVRDGIQGKVLVDFIIDEKGKVTKAKVLKGVDPDLDDEALRVINASPDWKPGMVKGKKVKAEISLYIEFRLQKKKNR